MISAVFFLVVLVHVSFQEVKSDCFIVTIENDKTQICKDEWPTRQLAGEARLRLQGNIPYFPANAFKGLSFFKEIRAIGVGLKDIHPDAFNGLSNTVFLNLDANKLQKIKKGTFAGLTALKVLRIAINEIQELEDGCFDGLGNLKTLKVGKNKISKLSSGTFTGLKSLTEVSFRTNLLSVIQPGLFSGLSRMQYLDLGENNFQSLPDKTFVGLNINMNFLDISFNKFTSIPTAVNYLSGLKQLNLMFNAISSLPNPWPLHNIRGMVVNNNKLSTVPGDLFNGVNFMFFGAINNPFVCDCHLEGFFNFVNELDKNGRLFRHRLQDYHCAMPDATKSFADITVQELRNTGNCS